MVTRGTLVRVKTPGSKQSSIQARSEHPGWIPITFCKPLVEKPVPSISASHSKGHMIVKSAVRGRHPSLKK